jgi:hypothetical protein
MKNILSLSRIGIYILIKMAISNVFSNLSKHLFTAEFNFGLMGIGSVVSYPIYTYNIANGVYKNPGVTGYMMSSIIAPFPSIVTGMATPILFYTYPIWFPIFFANLLIDKIK